MSRGDAVRRRVVVTGLGCVSPLGGDAASAWAAATAGASGAGALQGIDASELPVHIGAEAPRDVAPPDLPAKEVRRLDRTILLALTAADEAMRDGGLAADEVEPDRAAVAIGSGIGGVGTLLDAHDRLRTGGPRRVSPFVVPNSIGNMSSGYVALRYGFRGPNLSPVGACASGAQGIGEAARMIERGDAEVALAGGTDAAIQPLVVAAFASMRALSTRQDEPTRASRPFDRGRDGFLIGEGAGVLLLESLEHAKARGARLRAELCGYAVSADAEHMAAPPDDGHGAMQAMTRALQDAGLAPSDIHHVNAHATSTPAGDRIEAQAIRRIFGAHTDSLPVSATKSMTGHLLGAAGAVEAVFAIRALETGVLPPTINLDEPDPECALDHVANKAREAAIETVLSNSFGFGGINATLIFRRA